MALDTIEVAPEINVAALSNPDFFFSQIIERSVERVKVAMPCRIEKYNRATHLADLKVLFNWQMPNGKIIEGCVLRGITIHRMYAGGFIIDFPIKEGDTGWIIACDRDASDSKATRTPRLPLSPYCDSYVSGFWIPDLWGSEDDLNNANPESMKIPLKIDSSDEGRLVIQNAKGTQRISVGQDDIKVFATTVNVSASTVNLSGTTNITGDTNIDGKLTVSGLITATGDVVNASNIKLGTHHHDQNGKPIPG